MRIVMRAGPFLLWLLVLLCAGYLILVNRSLLPAVLVVTGSLVSYNLFDYFGKRRNKRRSRGKGYHAALPVWPLLTSWLVFALVAIGLPWVKHRGNIEHVGNAILTPTTAMTKHTHSSLTALKMMGLALMMYVNDHDGGFLPPNLTSDERKQILLPYVTRSLDRESLDKMTFTPLFTRPDILEGAVETLGASRVPVIYSSMNGLPIFSEDFQGGSRGPFCHVLYADGHAGSVSPWWGSLTKDTPVQFITLPSMLRLEIGLKVDDAGHAVGLQVTRELVVNLKKYKTPSINPKASPWIKALMLFDGDGTILSIDEEAEEATLKDQDSNPKYFSRPPWLQEQRLHIQVPSGFFKAGGRVKNTSTWKRTPQSITSEDWLLEVNEAFAKLISEGCVALVDPSTHRPTLKKELTLLKQSRLVPLPQDLEVELYGPGISNKFALYLRQLDGDQWWLYVVPAMGMIIVQMVLQKAGAILRRALGFSEKPDE